MSSIRLLDPAVVDRIAAGEVVERPASVVKELVENALDAGATRVAVRVENGGADLIEVEDDGHGIAAADAALAFAQHATSKIATVEDLEAIGTLGFRGEALASIGAVSRVELFSGTGDGPGIKTRVDGGEVAPVEPVAWPRGTTVRVADLFFNTPARRKHMKTRATELSHVARVVIDYALARPDVYFRLIHGDRTVVAAAPVATLVERVHQVLGEEAAAHWLAVEYRADNTVVVGGVTDPAHQRPNRDQVRWYVNDRPVSEYRLTHALVGAYESLLDARHYPVAAVFLTLAPNRVDVNVHPRKAEVRFADPGRIYGVVRTAVRGALAAHVPPATLRARQQEEVRDAVRDASGAGDRSAYGGLLERPPAGSGPEPRHAALPLTEWVVAEGTGRPSATAAGPAADAITLSGAGPGEGIAGTRGPIQPLAQYANTYILAADQVGLLIIDQHVAHERILYEDVLRQLEQRGVETQHLLVPETAELSAEESAVAEERREFLERLGFEIEPFGGATWAVRSAPAILTGRQIVVTLRSLLETVSPEGDESMLDRFRRSAAATIACHAAVRANHPLTREEMVRLVADLVNCEAPARCPHGRPVLLRVDLSEIEKSLGRR